MFIAMNRFQVALGAEADFEHLWLNRDVFLRTVPGFETFRLLRGPVREDHALYASHTAWATREAFEAWTRSEAFRDAHRNAGQAGTRALYNGPPQFEGFEVLQVVGRA